MNIEILTKAFGPVETNCVLLVNTSTSEAMVFDAPLGCHDWVRRECASREVELVALVFTHSHWDHTADMGLFADVPKYIHEADNYRLVEPMEHTLWPLPFTIEPVPDANFVEAGQTLNLAGIPLQVLHTPGHTEGGVCYWVEDHVIVGDTIFQGSVGRTDLPGGDYAVLLHSIKRLVNEYPEHATLYPGHGPTTTVAAELQHNPFVREALL